LLFVQFSIVLIDDGYCFICFYLDGDEFFIVDKV